MLTETPRYKTVPLVLHGTFRGCGDPGFVSQRHLVLYPDWLPAATVREIRWSGEEELSTNL